MADPLEIEHKLTIDGTEYHLFWLEAREAVDEIGWLRCEISDAANGPDPASLVNKKLEFTFSHKDGAEERKWVGYVVEASRSTVWRDEPAGTAVVARPHLFRLEQRADCRVFQDMTAPDIVKKVLDGAGVKDHEWRLEGSYPKRVYTSQYRESDWAFIRRLLSEEGIAFAVDCSSGKDVVTFFDGDLGDVEGEKEIAYGVGDGLVTGRDAIGALTHEKGTRSGKVELRDYNFEKPALKLTSKAEADDKEEKSLEVYVYPGRFTEPALGDRYAKVMLDAIRARRETVSGEASALRLQPGRKFALKDHPYDPLNREYLVLEVEIRHEARHAGSRAARHEGHRVGTGLRFVAIPTENTTYRPPRVERAVRAPGAQVAVVTGPPGKEIHPDKHGRVKVQFPWDRLGKKDDSSSLWIRTCQLPLGGSMLTPRVGWEVSLNFTDGDPDLPFVFGRMYNAKTPPPYALPKNKTRMSIQTATTPGGGSTNEFRMEDKKGGEEMFMNASKDATISAGNNATEDVGNNETRSIGANHALAVTDSLSNKVTSAQSTSVGGSQSLNVSTYMVDDVGSHSLTISGSRDLKAGGDHNRTITGASTLDVGGMQIDLVAGSVDEETMASMNDKVGAALVELTASDRTVTVKATRTETAGAAKVILSKGGRSVKVGASLKQKVAGAVLTKIKEDREDSSEGDFLEVAGGAQLVKATNVIFEAEDLLSVVMGASTITLTPASVSIAGTKITIDGEVAEEAALVADN
jgi:type VI secretion system secreted protein VgrG